MAKNIYCGSGKKQNEKWLKVTINPDKLREHIQEFNGNKFIKLNINIKDEPDQYGKDVSISVDTWKPEPKNEMVETYNDNIVTKHQNDTVEDSDVPF